jgi:hypothetical protein
MWFGFEFPLWPGMLSIFSFFFLTFGLLPLKKLLRFRKPKVTCVLLYMKYTPNTNTSNLMKNRFPKRRSHMRDGG